MQVTHLSPYDKTLIAFCINIFGTDEHPAAFGEDDGVRFFKADYVTKCLREGLASDNTTKTVKVGINRLLNENKIKN